MAVLSAEVLNGIRTAEAGFDPLPEGEYTVKVSKTEIKATKSGNGQYINAELSVLGPKFQGRKIFTRFNIVNPNLQAVQIGHRQLKELMTAAGMTQEQINRFNDTDQLLGLTCNANVEVKDHGEYGMQNEVKRYLKANANVPIPAGQNFSDAFATAPTSAADDVPWFK